LTALHRPADDTAGVEVDHDRQIGKAFQRPDVGDVGDPDAIRSAILSRLKLDDDPASGD
jgi:hypothetical protein